MSLHIKTIELVALGAAIGGNCVPCLEWHYKKCVELGVTKEELLQAMEMAKKVKQVPINKINEAAERLLENMNVDPGTKTNPGIGIE